MPRVIDGWVLKEFEHWQPSLERGGVTVEIDKDEDLVIECDSYDSGNYTCVPMKAIIALIEASDRYRKNKK